MSGSGERYAQIAEVVDNLRKRDNRPLDAGVILGSGLGILADQMSNVTKIPYGDLPHFPQSTVSGHAGQFVIGELEGRTLIMMQGRFHYYEGYAMQQVVMPVYVMRQLGIRQLLVTNAAGGLNPDFQAGDLMLIADHLNLTGDHPLIGPNDERFGPRFPDLSNAYDPTLRQLAREAAEQEQAAEQGAARPLREGVYAGISGPSYMTPAELKMLAKVGADALGMSTVPEVIAARHLGLPVLGISCITDMAIGEALEPLTHEQVVAMAEQTRPRFIRLMRQIIARLP